MTRMNSTPEAGIPSEGERRTVSARKPLPRPVLATLLIGGSLGGIATIMAGMLTLLWPTSQGSPQLSAEVPVNLRAADSAAYLPSSVGPGGPGVPLTAAGPTAPPPLPALQPLLPLTMTATTTTPSSSSSPLSAASLERTSTKPLRIRIPAIGVSAPIVSVGVRKSGEIQAPPLSRPNLTGWYRLGPAPGDQGPSVILGHLNTRSGSAVFNRLRELKRGNKISVLRADGKLAIFTVDGVEQVSKSTFPSNRVYGNTSTAALRLITCGGAYNAKDHSYTDNVVVYATLTAARRAARSAR